MWSIDPENKDLVWSQPEFGIGASALKGTANIQNANISTEPGQVMASFARTAQHQVAIADGTLTPDGDTLFDAPVNLKSGAWIKVTASTVSSISAATNPSTVDMDYVIVGGGGAGGNAKDATDGFGGGGGGGEVKVGSSVAFDVQTYKITVGSGVSGSTSIARTGQGGTSQIDEADGTLVDDAEGGSSGGIGYSGVSPTTNYNGGDVTDSGAGGGGTDGSNVGTGGVSTNGGDGGDATTTASGGGGSTANAGQDASGTDGGDGGDGTASSITGTSVTYGGGGGGAGSNSRGIGGDGGGGDGSVNANQAPEDGTDGLGGGGGGAWNDNDTVLAGGDGGDGVVIISYPTGSAYCIGGSVSYTSTHTVHTFTSDDVFEVIWINPGGLYYVSYKDDSDQIKLSSSYDPYGDSPLTHGTTGSITFDVLATVGKPIAKATEKYQTSSGTEYRYYVLDNNGRTWVYDTQVYDDTLSNNNVGVTWMLPDQTDYTNNKPKGIGILNGWLFLITVRRILCKPTVNLGQTANFMYNGWLTNPYDNHPNFVFTGSQGTLLYTDGNFIGEIYPTTSLVSSVANIQSYASYTASTTTGTIATLIGGSIPSNVDGTRVPVVFFAAEGGVLPTAVTSGTVYYIDYDLVNANFTVYTALTGGSTVNIETGASGTQYFNAFYPIGSDAGAGGSNPLLQFSSQRVNLPFYETAQKMIEVGNNVLIGCKGNIVYPWNQIDAVPTDVITLPESDVQTMINVNNTGYIFAGDKGNIYITNGTVASLTLKIPDYTAGVPGTPNSYIEPNFVWGDAIFCRGRVYTSILDQTATKAGNCGGIWSFIPSENVDQNQEVGSALRLENQNSYGDYNGYAPILINDEEQNGKSPKYWAAWQDAYDGGTPSYGIDYSTENPVTGYIVETDLLPTGTQLTQKTFSQLEYKLAVPLATGESVALQYRTNPTAAWSSFSSAVIQETTNKISGYYQTEFQKTQWFQARAVATTTGNASTSTFVPLKEIRLR